jgi:hypothetical protein
VDLDEDEVAVVGVDQQRLDARDLHRSLQVARPGRPPRGSGALDRVRPMQPGHHSRRARPGQRRGPG